MVANFIACSPAWPFLILVGKPLLDKKRHGTIDRDAHDACRFYRSTRSSSASWRSPNGKP